MDFNINKTVLSGLEKIFIPKKSVQLWLRLRISIPNKTVLMGLRNIFNQNKTFLLELGKIFISNKTVL